MCVFNGKLAISRKRWEIWPRLLLITKRKSHIGFQMTWKSLTLDELILIVTTRLLASFEVLYVCSAWLVAIKSVLHFAFNILLGSGLHSLYIPRSYAHKLLFFLISTLCRITKDNATTWQTIKVLYHSMFVATNHCLWHIRLQSAADIEASQAEQ